MRVAGVPFAALATLLAASLTQAQYLISELSFGHAGKIGSQDDPNKIPFFTVQGQPQRPEILSNKLILTPLAPGNQRGAIWAQQSLLRDHWIADVDFRANGPERGGGNLNIWLVKGGPAAVGSSSIYTVGRFDGLALVIDTHGGQGGMIRGFLNDGSKDYKSQHNVDELAFGHCSYAYRNLGRPSQIKLHQSRTEFSVSIDGTLCFKTDKFSVPTGYQFGITAATPDTPDSFEIFKMVVMTDHGESIQRPDMDGSQTGHKTGPPSSQKESVRRPKDGAVDFQEDPDEDPDVFKTSKTQFMDLHNRLQNTNHQLSSVYRTVSRHQQQDEKRHDEVHQLLGDIKAELRKLEEISSLTRKLEDLEGQLNTMRQDLGHMMHRSERTVKHHLDDHHSTLSQKVIESTPGHGLIIFVFLGTQVLVVGGYVLYKKRRNGMPKKYL